MAGRSFFRPHFRTEKKVGLTCRFNYKEFSKMCTIQNFFFPIGLFFDRLWVGSKPGFLAILAIFGREKVLQNARHQKNENSQNRCPIGLGVNGRCFNTNRNILHDFGLNRTFPDQTLKNRFFGKAANSSDT